jgi:hypothetical protein
MIITHTSVSSAGDYLSLTKSFLRMMSSITGKLTCARFEWVDLGEIDIVQGARAIKMDRSGSFVSWAVPF